MTFAWALPFGRKDVCDGFLIEERFAFRFAASRIFAVALPKRSDGASPSDSGAIFRCRAACAVLHSQLSDFWG